MANGYVRQSAAEIVDDELIEASDFNNEFNALQSAFNGTTGHAHDGTTGNGPKINLATSITGYLPVANGGTAGKNNFTAVVQPTEFDDSSDDYVVGSIWLNHYGTNQLQMYVCEDATENAAVWTPIENYSVAGNAIAQITPAADTIAYFDGVDTAASTSLTAFARTILDDANAATVRSTIAAPSNATTISAGTGLTGGGDLSANRTISLNSASQASLAKADTAIQSADLGTAASKDIGDFATAAQGTKADGAVQSNGSSWTPHPSSTRDTTTNTFYTNFGYISLGPANASYAHFNTDAPGFYFYKRTTINGTLTVSGITSSAAVSITGTLDASGIITSASHLITSTGVVRSDATQNIFATGSAGTIYLRPNGYNSATAQATLSSAGTFTATKFVGDGSGLTNLPAAGGVVNTVTAGNGLTGGGSSSTVSLAVGQGTGISVASTTVSVDSTVWRDGSLPTVAQIDGIIAGTALGAVGSYAFLDLEGTGAGSIVAGNTYAGSGLSYSGVRADGSYVGNQSPAGTWMAMGTVANGGSTPGGRPATVFLRIA